MQNCIIIGAPEERALINEMEQKLPYASAERQKQIKYAIDLLSQSGGKFVVMLLQHDGKGIEMAEGLENKFVWEKGNDQLTDRRGAPILHIDRWLLVTDPDVKDNWDHQIFVNYLSKQPFIVKMVRGSEEDVGRLIIDHPQI